MDVYSFVKSSTIIDIACLLLVLFSSLVLSLTAIALAIWAKRRKWLFVVLVAALFPLIIALAGATFRYVRSERLLTQYAQQVGEDNAARFRAEFRSEFLITTGIGVAGTALPLIIGLGGLVFKKSAAASVEDPK